MGRRCRRSLGVSAKLALPYLLSLLHVSQLGLSRSVSVILTLPDKDPRLACSLDGKSLGNTVVTPRGLGVRERWVILGDINYSPIDRQGARRTTRILP